MTNAAHHHRYGSLAACLRRHGAAVDRRQRDACSGDFGKFCKGTVPGGGRIIACLGQHNAQLTPACQKALAAAEKK